MKANKTNNGIICNYLSAIELAQGKYIKYISPGDYIYDEVTLKKCVAFMEKYGAELAFGKALYYRDMNNDLQILSKSDPVFTELYNPDKSDYDFDNILKHLILWQDCILGAAVIADRLVFERYLREIVGKVKYIEDNTVMPLATLDRKRIYYFNEYILWYECDSGISTNINRGFLEKIQLDFLSCYKLLKDKQPNNSYIRLVYLYQKMQINKNKVCLSVIKRILDIFYGRVSYKREKTKKQFNYFLTIFDVNNWYNWREYK